MKLVCLQFRARGVGAGECAEIRAQQATASRPERSAGLAAGRTESLPQNPDGASRKYRGNGRRSRPRGPKRG